MTKDKARKILQDWRDKVKNRRHMSAFELAAINVLLGKQEWVCLKDFPLDESMVGQWAWVTTMFDDYCEKTNQPQRVAMEIYECDAGIVFKQPVDYIIFLAENPYYQLIGHPPEFKE